MGITISAVAMLLISWPRTAVRRTARRAARRARRRRRRRPAVGELARPRRSGDIAVDSGIMPATRITVVHEIDR